MKGNMKRDIKNPKRISVRELLVIEGFETVEDMIGEYIQTGAVPACCEAGCLVELDGECLHGHPSFLIALGSRLP